MNKARLRRKAVEIAIAAIDGANDEISMYLPDNISAEEKEAISMELHRVQDFLTSILVRSMTRKQKTLH